jgi:hypothetical protein
MKFVRLLTAAAISASALVMAAPLSAAVPPSAIGRILLDVSRHGEAWYVDPQQGTRTYLADGDAAYSLLRSNGLGITNADLARIPVGLHGEVGAGDLDSDFDGLIDDLETALGTNANAADSDGDGYDDAAEIGGGYNPVGPGMAIVETGLIDRLAGRILIQTEKHGEAWYLHPVDRKRYYMPDGDAAYAIMRQFGLGATTTTITSIPASEAQVDCGADMGCFAESIGNRQPSFVVGAAPNPSAQGAAGAIALLEVWMHPETHQLAFRATVQDAADLSAPVPIAVTQCNAPDEGVLLEAVKRWEKGSFGMRATTTPQDGYVWQTGEYGDLGGCRQYTQEAAAVGGYATTHQSAIEKVLGELGVARANARDAKRVTDVVLIQTALGLYFADVGSYPTAASGLTLGSGATSCLQAGGFSALCTGAVTSYMQTIPVAPTPADGSCSEAQNAYVYTSASGNEYAISYCLGSQVGDRGAGPGTATSSGAH